MRIHERSLSRNVSFVFRVLSGSTVNGPNICTAVPSTYTKICKSYEGTSF